MTTPCRTRLSPCSRGEDEVEGLRQPCPESTLSLPLSLQKGEATQYTHRHSQIAAQT